MIWGYPHDFGNFHIKTKAFEKSSQHPSLFQRLADPRNPPTWTQSMHSMPTVVDMARCCWKCGIKGTGWTKIMSFINVEYGWAMGWWVTLKCTVSRNFCLDMVLSENGVPPPNIWPKYKITIFSWKNNDHPSNLGISSMVNVHPKLFGMSDAVLHCSLQCPGANLRTWNRSGFFRVSKKSSNSMPNKLACLMTSLQLNHDSTNIWVRCIPSYQWSSILCGSLVTTGWSTLMKDTFRI